MDINVVGLLVNAGIGGLIVLLLISGQLVTGREHKRLEDDYAKAMATIESQRQQLTDLLVWASTGARALQAVAQVAEERSGTPPGGGP